MRLSNARIEFVVVILFLITLPIALRIPNPYGNPLIQEVHETSHTVLFFFAQLWLMFYTKRLKPSWSLSLTVLSTACLTAVIGGLIEIIQPHFNRSGNWRDWLRDLLGILGAAGLYLGWHAKHSHLLIRVSGYSVAFLAVGLSLIPITSTAHRQWMRYQQFPVLMDFEAATLNRLLRRAEYGKLKVMPAPQSWSENDSQVLRVTMPKATRWSGFVLFQPFPYWDGYRELKFQVFSESPELTRIALNIYSVETRNAVLRYRAFDVKQGLNEFSVDLSEGKPIQDHHINRLLWYSITPERDVVLYFDHIHLVR